MATGHASIGWRVAAAVLFVLAGLNHFRTPQMYAQIVPPIFPDPALLVVISGIAEIVGGVGLLIRPLRWTSAIGLIALLVAVFPANVWVAIHPELFSDFDLPAWIYWARLPAQPLLIFWVWRCR